MEFRLPLSLLFAVAATTAGAGLHAAVNPSSPAATHFSDPLISSQWQWDPEQNGVDVSAVWEKGITGSGVVIGIIDEWVEPNHEDLNVSPYNPAEDWTTADFSDGLSYDFVDTESTTDDESQIYTDESHGTFVAGMAAATGGNDVGLTGAAPGATIAGLHVDLNSEDTLTAAVWWASGVSTAGIYTGEAAIQVKNCSFGSVFDQSGMSDFLEAIEATSNNNVIYVFAAGNARPMGGSYGIPANTGWSSEGNSSDIINVAATSSDGVYSSFSSYGSNIFISAPGSSVVSTDRTGAYGYNSGGSTTTSDDGTETTTDVNDSDYATSDGPSFAAPLVSGVIALGKEICPVMDVRWAKWALAYSSGYDDAPNIDAVYDETTGTYVQASNLTSTSTDATGEWGQNGGGYWFNNNYGFGIIDPEGFVETVQNIAYTTVETTYSATTASITKTNTSGESSGDTSSASFAVSTTVASSSPGSGDISRLNQSVETVSVTVTLSEAALESLDLNSLTVTLTDSNGYSSVLVEPSLTSDTAILASSLVEDGETSWSYTFLSNAFWGTTYTSGNDWTVTISYDGVDGVDMTDYVTVSSVDFTMGAMVFERDNLTIAANDTVNAHALVLDSGSFTVYGKFYVEDAVYINAGTFNISGATGGSTEKGEVGAYSAAELNKGAIYVQTGGTANVAGNATFARGLYLYGGTFNLNNTSISTGTGTVVYGGAFNVYGFSGVGSTLTLAGGSLTLYTGNGSTAFSSPVIVNGGTFVMQSGTTLSSTLTMNGGTATLAHNTKVNSITVGATATSEDTSDTGGLLTIAAGARVTAQNVSFAGIGRGLINTNVTLSGNLSVSGNAAVSISTGTTVSGVFSVSGGTAAWNGELTATGGVTVSGGTLAAAGTTSLNTTALTVSSGGTFSAGKTTVNYYATTGENAQSTTVNINSGATLEFASTTRDDFMSLTISSGVKFNLETTDTKVVYDFGDAIPFSADIVTIVAPTTETTTTDDLLFTIDGEILTTKNHDLVDGITVELSESAPKILEFDDKTGKFKESDLEFEVYVTSTDTVEIGDTAYTTGATLSIDTEQDLKNHLLRYSYQTALQNAVQETLILNDGIAADFLNELDALNRVSDVLTAYDKLGTPINVIAIDELHDKQANAITSAISRRSRELRSGFIHSDMWSNPLFGQAGFSYSAKPSLVAATGFVPYLTAEDDFPLMVWINGGFSFSEADGAASSVSSSKTSMFNVEMGVDYSVSEELAIGFFAGYTTGRTKFDGSSSRSEIQSRNIGVYATGSVSDAIGSFYYTGVAAIGFEEYDFRRTLTLGSLRASADANPDGLQGIGFIEAGYEWRMEKFSMGPSVSLRYVSNNINDYTESSSATWMRLDVDSVSYDSLQTSIGWRAAYRADFEVVSLMPEVRASWNHEFLGVDEDFDAKLALADARSYSNTIAETGDDYATVGVGLTVMLGEVSTLSFDYDVQLFRENADPTHTINAIFRTRF